MLSSAIYLPSLRPTVLCLMATHGSTRTCTEPSRPDSLCTRRLAARSPSSEPDWWMLVSRCWDSSQSAESSYPTTPMSAGMDKPLSSAALIDWKATISHQQNTADRFVEAASASFTADRTSSGEVSDGRTETRSPPSLSSISRRYPFSRLAMEVDFCVCQTEHGTFWCPPAGRSPQHGRQCQHRSLARWPASSAGDGRRRRRLGCRRGRRAPRGHRRYWRAAFPAARSTAPARRQAGHRQSN
jgi:hypothetical protein